MTLLLKPEIEPGNASMLTLVMGMAVRDALKQAAGLDAWIKWPNDIVCDGRKICGILTEMSAQVDYINHIVIGVGINVAQPGVPGRGAGGWPLLCTGRPGKAVCRARLAAEVAELF